MLHFDVLVEVGPVQHFSIGVELEMPELFGGGVFEAWEAHERHHQPPPVTEQHGEFMLADEEAARLRGRRVSEQFAICNRRHAPNLTVSGSRVNLAFLLAKAALSGWTSAPSRA